MNIFKMMRLSATERAENFVNRKKLRRKRKLQRQARKQQRCCK